MSTRREEQKAGGKQDQNRPVIGPCAYCRRVTELCRSHAVPNAVFRSISRKNNGSLIGLPKGRGKVHRTSDTGAFYLLCRACETDFNRRFDGPLVNGLKALDRAILAHGFGARVSFDTDQFARCIASVFWRCCVSPAVMYSKTNVSSRHRAAIRTVMDASPGSALRLASVRLARLYDPTPPGDGQIGQDVISDFVLNPNPYILKVQDGAEERVGFDVTLSGFLIHLIVPRLPHRLNRRAEYLRRGQTELHAPAVSLFDYPPLLNAAVDAVRRADAGDVTPAAR